MDTTYRHYGSPFRICHRCQKTFVDRSYKELACLNYRNIKEKKIDPFSVFSSFIGLLFLVFALLQAADPENGGMHILFLIVGVFMLFGGGFSISKDLSSYQSRCKLLEQELARSKKRLSNPAYARSLVKLGIDVPKEYLSAPPTKSNRGTIYYMESANGMIVRVPEGKLDTWQKAQEGQGQQLTGEQKRMIKDKIIREIYGPKLENK